MLRASVLGPGGMLGDGSLLGAAADAEPKPADSAADAGPQHVDVSDLIGRCGFLCSVQSGKKDALQAVGWRWCTPSLKAPSFKLCL